MQISLPTLLVLSLLLVCQGQAQGPDPGVKFRLAQSYEQSGDFEKAAQLFSELHAADPGNVVYFDGLQRVLLQLKRYDTAIALLEKKLAAHPADFSTLTTLGGVYYKAGREQDALRSWDKALAVEPSNPNLYRIVAGVMLENRLLEKTAELYRRARVACKDPSLFTMDLAQLLAVSMDYAGATTELVRWLRQNPTQLAFVQGRIGVFSGREEGRNAALQVVRSELARGEDQRLLELLAWLHMEGKEFTQALGMYRRIDRLSNAKGEALFTFAERAFKEKAYAIALQAYEEAIRTPVSAQRMPFAKYGYASALKELSILSDTALIAVPPSVPATESMPRYAGAIAYFQQIIAEYPRTEFSARSYYQIGRIQLERFFDLDGALKSFQSVEGELPALNLISYAVSLKIGEVLTAKGDTAEAARRFAAIAAASMATPDQQDEATFRLAELDYFDGRFPEAIERLQGITAHLNADYANDALLLLSFLQENVSGSEQALKDVGRADFLARQRKNSEAITLLLAVIQQNSRALLVDDALMKVAALQTEARRYQDALASYERLLQEFRESSIALDRAQFGKAEIYHYGLRDPARAIAAYEQLLTDYPQSLYGTEARRRIRALRGDPL